MAKRKAKPINKLVQHRLPGRHGPIAQPINNKAVVITHAHKRQKGD